MKIGKEMVDIIQTTLGPLYGNCFLYNRLLASRVIHEKIQNRIWNNLDLTVVEIGNLNLEER